MQIYAISEGDRSTLIGMNGGMIESPSGNRIVYAKKKDLNAREGMEIWVCDRDLSNHRHIFTVSCLNHNGPSATFLNENDIVFRDGSKGLNSFVIMNVDTLEVKHRIFAKESHREENGIYPFSVSNEFLGANSEYPEINCCGIYLMDLSNGKISLAVTEEEIVELVKENGFTPTEFTGSVSHVQLNPSATSVMARISVAECPTFGALGAVDLKDRKMHLIPDKPVHQLWYDDDTYMATRQFKIDERIDMATSYIARFTKDGEELEVLGGIANHIDGNSERNLFAGDRCYPGYSPDIYVYSRGCKKPEICIPMADLQDMIWKKQVHPNPSFSKDGKRLYFNRPINNEKTVASFIEL